jgi:hypothetical protein
MSLGSQLLMFKHNVVIQSASIKVFEKKVSLDVMNNSPSDARSHPRGMDTSAIPSCKPKTLTKCHSYTFTPDFDKFYADTTKPLGALLQQ